MKATYRHELDRRGRAAPNGEKPSQKWWYKLDREQALRTLESSRDGLDSQEVQQRIAQYGKNRIGRRRRVSAWEVLLHQFKSPLIYVLLGALVAVGITSMATGEATCCRTSR